MNCGEGHGILQNLPDGYPFIALSPPSLIPAIPSRCYATTSVSTSTSSEPSLRIVGSGRALLRLLGQGFFQKGGVADGEVG